MCNKVADIYKFKVKLCELESIMWRDIEITSVSSVAKLGYAVLAAFESTASHLFNIKFEGKTYEIVFDNDEFNDDHIIDPIKTKLSKLDLSIGNKMTMAYDYGAGWEFEIELLSIIEMKRGTGTHYPYVTDGQGKGIIEDIFPHELVEIVDKIDKGESLPQITNMYDASNRPWDYRDFDLEFCNIFFKDNVWRIQNAYEMYSI